MLNEQDILHLAAGDAWMMDVMRAARSLGLPDWWVCAGFVRSKIWDTLHGFAERTPLADVDVVYFDPGCLDEAVEKTLERKLLERMPGVPWSVKNQARMHVVNGNPPYSSSVDAISKFPETVTALGFQLDAADRLRLTAPSGIGDVASMTVRPTPMFSRPELAGVYAARIAKKDWQRTWHRVRVEMPMP
ncbi:nucleotidyltransferase family protein [Paenibacillus lycopersici]|uniref:Nucleotidyltransferase family protein n=1 Tax=Paenibacillus lycopersici TaxID=2704462 RepID=A0A6C0FPL7_9BACL|nr:nucleotidyltransferase family protein [Paenibacillus lycopersici]QHT59068.1 nucleotidyltransferase family protein [Paenibacillus lycopersici]